MTEISYRILSSAAQSKFIRRLDLGCLSQPIRNAYAMN